MADDVKIQVSAPGADKAASDLNKVAGAEKAVVKASGASTTSLKSAKTATVDAGQATKELDERNRTLAERFRAFGPEAALVGDAIDSLALKEGSAAAIAGILGVAVLGLTMIYQRYSAAQAEEKANAEALLTDLKAQHKAYMDIAKAVEEARLAKVRMGQTADAPGVGITSRVVGVAKEAGLGAAGVQTVAESLATGGEALNDEQLVCFGKWVALGYAKDISDPGERRMRFMALWRRGGLAAKLDAEMAQSKGAAPYLYAERAAQTRELQRGLGPKAIIESAMARVERGEGMKAGEIAELVEDLDSKVLWWRSAARDRIKKLLSENRDEMKIVLRQMKKMTDEQREEYEWIPEYTYEAAMQGQSQWPWYLKGDEYYGGYTSTPKGDRYYRTYQRPDDDRFTGTPPASRVGSTYANHKNDQGVTVYNGGTHYHNHDKLDPAGEVVPSGMTND